MSKITIHVSDRGMTFRKGEGQFTIPGNRETNRKQNIFHVGRGRRLKKSGRENPA